MNKTLLKNILTYAGIVLLLAGIAYSFVPQVLDGKIVNQSDIAGWKGMAHEALEHNKANPDDPTAWTGSTFAKPMSVYHAPESLLVSIYQQYHM